MVAWIQSFSDTYYSLTHRFESILYMELTLRFVIFVCRYPVIYTTVGWWIPCTGDSAAFATNNPLWVANYSSTVGQLPAGWSNYSFWQ